MSLTSFVLCPSVLSLSETPPPYIKFCYFFMSIRKMSGSYYMFPETARELYVDKADNTTPEMSNIYFGWQKSTKIVAWKPVKQFSDGNKNRTARELVKKITGLFAYEQNSVKKRCFNFIFTFILFLFDYDILLEYFNLKTIVYCILFFGVVITIFYLDKILYRMYYFLLNIIRKLIVFIRLVYAVLLYIPTCAKFIRKIF